MVRVSSCSFNPVSFPCQKRYHGVLPGGVLRTIKREESKVQKRKQPASKEASGLMLEKRSDGMLFLHSTGTVEYWSNHTPYRRLKGPVTISIPMAERVGRFYTFLIDGHVYTLEILTKDFYSFKREENSLGSLA